MISLVIRKTALAGVTALMLCVVPSCWMEVWAQRTMRGESFLGADALWCAGTQSPVGGAQIHYGQYLLSSCWKAGVSAMQLTGTDSDGYSVPYAHVAAYGEWMYRLAGTRNRMLNLYGGGGVFLGYEAYGPWDEQWSLSGGQGSDGAFLYGLQAGLEAEFFFTRKLALVISGKVPVNFSSPYGWLHATAGAGLRMNF